MGKFSYKKRKGTRKQSFKNRKRVKKGGGNTEGKDAAGATTTDNTDQNVAAVNIQEAEQKVDNTGDAAGVAAGQTETATDNRDQNVAENTQEAEQIVDNTGDAQADANVNATGTEGENKKDDTEDANEDANAEKVLEDQPLTTEDQEALKQADDLDPKEMDALANQLADDPNANIPLWAKAAIKSGAVGKAVDFLNKHPDLKKAIEKRAINAIQNSGSGSTSAPGAPNAGTGAPGANTGAAAPGGSYTADDAGYQKFVETVKTNPETLKNVVYVNDQMSQIFLKNSNGWIEIKK